MHRPHADWKSAEWVSYLCSFVILLLIKKITKMSGPTSVCREADVKNHVSVYLITPYQADHVQQYGPGSRGNLDVNRCPSA